MPAIRTTSRRLTAVAVAVTVATIAAVLVPARESGAAAASWSVGGPYGGSVRAVAVSPHDSNLVLTATNEGVFRSGDGGGHWSPASGGLSNVTAGDVAFDVDEPSVAYAATADGVFRSVDGGRTWRDTGGIRSYDVESTSAAVFAGSAYGLQVSRNDGDTWKTIYDPGPDVISEWTVAPSSPRVIYLSKWVYADDTGHLYRSGDGGVTWHELTSLDGARDLVVDPANPNLVYAATSGGTLARSDDGGATWSPLSGLDAPDVSDVAVSPTDPSIVLTSGSKDGGRSVYRTTDGGLTWTSTMVAGLQEGPELEIDPTNPQVVFFGGRGDGVYRSVNGGASFDHANTGLTAQSAAAIATDPEQPGVMYTALGGAGGLFRSPDAGRTWQRVSDGLVEPADPYQLPEFTSIAVAADGDVFVARHLMTAGGYTLMGSQDGGATWQRRDQGLPTGKYPEFVVAHPTDPDLLLATVYDYSLTTDRLNGMTFRSSDGGATWSQVPELDVVVRSISVDPRNARVIVATGDTYDSFTGDDRLYSSSDFGQSWTRLRYPKSLGFVGAVTYDSRVDRIYAGSGRDSLIARSDDGGETWTTADLYGAYGITALKVDPMDVTQVLAGTQYNGTWMSRDGGQSWQSLNPGVRGMSVNTLTFGEAPPPSTASFSATATTSTTIAMSYRPAYIGVGNRTKSGLAKMMPRPHNRSRPAVTGTARVGRRLHCEPGRWTRAAAFSYRWFRGDTKIVDATGSSYLIVRADKGRRVTCAVTARGPGGMDRATSRGVFP